MDPSNHQEKTWNSTGIRFCCKYEATGFWCGRNRYSANKSNSLGHAKPWTVHGHLGSLEHGAARSIEEAWTRLSRRKCRGALSNSLVHSPLCCSKLQGKHCKKKFQAKKSRRALLSKCAKSGWALRRIEWRRVKFQVSPMFRLPTNGPNGL
jgi:hypothetical protein